MKLGQLAQIVFIALAALAVYGFVTVGRDAEVRRTCLPLCAMRPAYAAQNRTAPDFELRDMDGRSVKLSDYRGKTVILNFWTKTCQPCLEEMPSLAELARMVAHRSDVALLTISTDEGPSAVRDILRAILRTERPPFPVLFDPESEVVGDAYGTTLYPETWIIDKKGVIRARFDGARDWSSTMVLSLLDSLNRAATCSAEFEGGRPTGRGAVICGDAVGG